MVVPKCADKRHEKSEASGVISFWMGFCLLVVPGAEDFFPVEQ